MVIGSNLDMMPDGIVQTTVEDSLRGPNANLENSLHSEIQLILKGLRGQDFVQQGRDLNMYRSGSAPPTVEGSLNAVGSLFKNPDIHESNSSGNANGVLSEDDIRLHPAYLSYYYSHDNINPRLPPPLLSKEDWRVAQRFQAGAPSFVVNGDPRRMKLVDDRNSSSLFSMQPGISLQRPENEFMGPSKATVRSLVRQSSAEWLERAPPGLAESGTGMGSRRKSFADILQEGLEQPTSLSGCLTSPGSCNGVCGAVDGTGFPTSHQGELCNGGATISHHFASAVGSSLSRSTTPEAQIVGRSSCPGLPPVSGKSFPIEKNTVGLNVQDGLSSRAAKLNDISASFSSLKLSGNRNVEEDSHLQSQLQQEFDNQHDLLFNMPNVRSQNLQQQYISNTRPEKMGLSTDLSDFARKNGSITEPNVSKMGLSRQGSFPRRTSSSANLHSHMNSSGLGNLEGSNCQGTNISGMGNATNVPAGYFLNNNMSSEVNSHLDTALSDFGDGRSSSRSRSQAGPDLHFPVIDSQYAQYSRRPDYVSHGSANTSDPYPASNHISTSHGNLLGLQKAYLDSILAQQKQQYELLHISKCGGMDHGYYVNPSYSHGMPFQNRLASFPVRSGGPTMFQNERFSRSWNSDSNSAMDGRYASSLLEEFKSNKTSAFELSDIVDHVVEFSKDQYGSRFIQQKLEIATMEEKTKIFLEIVPHAPTLMTDVFGNYVIQKFFEHGTESQRKELAGQLTGHVLPLSLQMYGCRVIQKALEVVDVDQQTSLVSELDGSVMKCVRDQNGNHVIQKCIECVPQHRIQFIITAFYGQVVALSTHPYGCRVIQRVLEHCDEMNAQQIIMDEVMQSVCTLAQDQYGNYVIQHVLQHGKAHERSDIISKLAGQIVKMSQQKFASNVVEKCLTFGGPEERQLLVNEMLGSTDENEPLQAMMKDPFGNYVVQKVLETCDDQSRELILSRIKVHLNTLKRYTYGKHIVSRVEKLITAGERHAALSSSFSS